MSAGPIPLNERELFDRVLDRPAGQSVEAFLREACPEDAALRARVADMVGRVAASELLLEDKPRPWGETGGEQPGQWLGPYRLVEIIGEGGFGVVWKAEQEAPVRRVVTGAKTGNGLETAVSGFGNGSMRERMRE